MRTITRCVKADQRPLRGAGEPGWRCRSLLSEAHATDSSLFPQVATGQVDKHILQARLARGEVQKLRALFLDRIEQRGNGQVRLTHVEADQTIVVTNRLHARQRSPGVEERTVASCR